MANVLTKGAILTDNIMMQRVWAVTQCVVKGKLLQLSHNLRQHKSGLSMNNHVGDLV